MTRLLRSSAFRIAFAFALAVTLTTYGVFALVYWQFSAANVGLVKTVLSDEVKQSVDVPLDRLKTHLALRLTQDLRRIDFVGLYDASGRRILGNAASTIPVPIDGKAHLISTPPPAGEPYDSEDAIFVATRRADGDVLLLGRSLVYVDELEATMLQAFVIAIVPVILVALIAGIIVSIRASRRLTTIKDAIDGVMHGDLAMRLPARGTPDDIDELVRAVNLMLDEIDRLVHQIRSVGDNIAHDLRAPLAVMRARLERGLAGGSEATLRQLTTEALGDLERAMTTVTALLRISELESGLRRGSFGTVDLAAVCRDAFDLYEPLAEAKGIAMHFAAADDVVVTGDGDLLREAIANLVDNAVKFSPRGGEVQVICGKDALVRISDDGPGVPPDEREKVVKRFYRAPGARHHAGTGLGLSMASTIVELHGFVLRIGDNAPGAVFEILPGPSSAAPAVDRNATAAAPRIAARA